MFGHKPASMLNNPAARWRTVAGLRAEATGHPAPDYVSRRQSEIGPGPGYGEGFGGPIGGDRDLSDLSDCTHADGAHAGGCEASTARKSCQGDWRE